MKKNSSKAVSTLFASLLLMGFLGSITSHFTYALLNTMTFTTGDTINFSSVNETTFWSNVTMEFGTGIRIQFVETVPNGYLEPCDWIRIIWPQGFYAEPCSWWEVLDSLGNPTGIEFHIDALQGPEPGTFHVDYVFPSMPPYPPLPPQPVTAELKIQVVEPCDFFVVHWPEAWYPQECSWWEIMDPETGLPTGFEFHVDWNNQSCEFHVDQVTPHIYTPYSPVYEIKARQKITEIEPCDWFVVLDPAGLVPSPCSWWSVWRNGMPLGGRFHVDSVNGRAFHVDQANPNPINLSSSPEYPTTARQNIGFLRSCQWYKVDDLANAPKPCTWWKVLVPGLGGQYAEFHVDQSYLNNGTFHIDNVLDTLFPWWPSNLTAEKEFVGLGPCDWFQVANPQGWLPEPCSWWKVTWPTEWAGVSFHVDSTDGVSKFHVDAADSLPPGPTPPPWNVTAVRAQPPSGPWYVKPAYPDYAPSGMPDFDENQDAWGPNPGTFTWCGPVAVANSLWWLDSEFESILNPNPVAPPTISDNFNLVSAWGNWDDHDVKNVDPLVHNLAFWMDTDGQRTGDGHKGTRWEDMEWGINQYLIQQGVAGMFEVHNRSARVISPQLTFEWIESEIEKCQDVVLFLEFWQWTGSKWTNETMTNPSLEFGHFVTCAGVNSTTSELLISDPYKDAFEAGTAPRGGRSPVPHPPIHPPQIHNDTQYVSQDAYQVATWSPPPLPPPPPPPFPQAAVELVGYMPGYYTFITAAVVTSPSGVHDVAVTNLTSAKTVICQGYCGNLTVTVQNQGNFTETFNATVYANTTAIQTKTLMLTSGSFTTLIFTWNTSGFARGKYTLSAYAWPVPGETDTADNNFTDGWVRVSMVGDLTGGTPNPWDFVPDGKVDGKDIAIVALCFGSAPGCLPPYIWNPNCDVDNDAKIDGKDIATVALHFGHADP